MHVCLVNKRSFQISVLCTRAQTCIDELVKYSVLWLFPHFQTDKFLWLSSIRTVIFFPISSIFVNGLFYEFNKYKNRFYKYTLIKNQRKNKNWRKFPLFQYFGYNFSTFPVCSKFPNFSLTGNFINIFQSMWDPSVTKLTLSILSLWLKSGSTNININEGGEVHVQSG